MARLKAKEITGALGSGQEALARVILIHDVYLQVHFSSPAIPKGLVFGLRTLGGREWGR